MRETLTILLILCATGALIAWFDWVLEGLPDALDYRAGEFSDRPWGDWPALHPEMRPGAAARKGGGAAKSSGQVRTGDRPSHGHHEGASNP